MSSGGTFFNAPSGTHMVPSSSELIQAVKHSARRRILWRFVEEPQGRASAGELAEALEQPAAQIDYHLKTLARCRLLRLSRDRCGWSLDVDPEWLGLVLEVWAESGCGTAREDANAAARRPPPRGRSGR